MDNQIEHRRYIGRKTKGKFTTGTIYLLSWAKQSDKLILLRQSNGENSSLSLAHFNMQFVIDNTTRAEDRKRKIENVLLTA